MPQLSDANGSNFSVSGGATLTLPDLTSYTQPNFETSSTRQASRGLQRLLNGASIRDGQNDDDGGGDVELPALTQSNGPVVLSSNPGSGTIDVAVLATFAGGTVTIGRYA